MSRLDEALAALNKRFGKDYISRGGLTVEYKRHTLGIDALDIALGGGLPERRIAMFAGRFSAGKSTTAITATANVQKAGGRVAWLDTEGAMDLVWASKFGVDTKSLLICRPQTVEEATDVMETLIMSGELALIVLDSVAVMPSAKELESSAESKSMGGTAKALGLCMKKVVARLNDPKVSARTSIILINQLRDNISGYGSPTYTPGERALHHACDIIVWLTPDTDPVGGKESAVGVTVKFKVIKNRTAPPLRIGSYNLMFKGFIDNKRSIVELAIAYGKITKSGSIYSYTENKELKKVKGIDNLVAGITDKLVAQFKSQISEEVAKGNFETKPLSEEEIILVTD